MKTINITLAGLMVSGALVQAEDTTDLNQKENRFTLSARLGFNIHAKFSNRLTPDGLRYNYLDGYVLGDSTGNYDPTDTFDGITQNWGYDNSGRQRDAAPTVTVGEGEYPSVAMTRFASGVDPLTSRLEDDPIPGVEFGYMRHLGNLGKCRYGLEFAFNFQKVDLTEGGTVNGAGVQDYYAYFNGTSLPDSPYQGRFGPGSGGPQDALISDTIAGSNLDPVSLSLNSHRDFEADVWGFRLGPYLERQFGERLMITAIGGLAVAVVDGEAAWNQTLTVGQVTDPTISGHSTGSDLLYGYYVGASAVYQISDRWNISGGVQYQDIGNYRQNVGQRRVELDLTDALFLQLGISYKF